MIDVEVLFKTAPDKTARIKARCHPEHSLTSLVKNCIDKIQSTIPSSLNVSDIAVFYEGTMLLGGTEGTLVSKGIKATPDGSPVQLHLVRVPATATTNSVTSPTSVHSPTHQKVSSSFPSSPPSAQRINVTTVDSASNTEKTVSATPVETQVDMMKELGQSTQRDRLEMRHREVSSEIIAIQQRIAEARKDQKKLTESSENLHRAAQGLSDKNDILRERVAEAASRRTALQQIMQTLAHVPAESQMVLEELRMTSVAIKQAEARIRELRSV
eukprot:PhF_6_TR31424/c1_g1_i2/m.46080